MSKRKTPRPRKLTPEQAAELVQIEEDMATISVQALKMFQEARAHITASGALGFDPRELRPLYTQFAYRAPLATLARFAWACGYKLEVRLVKKDENKT